MSDLIQEIRQIIAKKLQSEPGATINDVVTTIRSELDSNPSLIEAIKSDNRLVQNISRDAKGFQTVVKEGGIANFVNHFHLDAREMAQQLAKLLQELVSQNPPNNLPRSGVKNFIGRSQKLQILHEQLQNSQRIAITALEGMGGIGKTELALQYAISQFTQKHYPGGFCWLQARDQKIATQIVSFAQTKLGLTLPDELDEKGQVDYSWGHWKEGDVLIVLDDVTDFDAVSSYLPPSDPRFKVLITTRQNFGSSVQSLPIEELDDENALALLETLVGPDRIQSQLEKAKTLCNWVGNLPLGLELLGRFLARKPDWSFQKLIERLESKRLEAKALTETESGMTAQLGVVAALELSWIELREEEQELACLLGMFAVAPIPWHLVEACLCDQDKEELEDIRDEGLRDRNLLKRVGQSTYQLHQIIQEFFRIKLEGLNGKRKMLKTAYCKEILTVSQSIDDNPAIDLIVGIQKSIPHVEELINKWFENLSDEDLIWPYACISRFYEGQGFFSEAIIWRESCLSKCKERFGETHAQVAISINNLAELYRKLGRYDEAIKHHKKSLQIRESLYNDDNESIANALGNLATDYSQTDNLDKAEPLFQRSLKIRKAVHGRLHPDVAESLNDLARLYQRKGNYALAKEKFIEAIEIYKAFKGTNSPNYYTILVNYGSIRISLGELSGTEKFLFESLELGHKLLGDSHPTIAYNLQIIGNFYYVQGKYFEAREFYNDALIMQERILGYNHHEVAKSLTYLGEVNRLLKNYEDAEILFNKSLEILRGIVDSSHSDVSANLNNLALTYQSLNRLDEAEELYFEVLRINQSIYGDNHPDVALSYNNIGWFFQGQSKFNPLSLAEAEKYYRIAIDIYDSLKLENDKVIITLNNLAKIYCDNNRYDDAEPLFHKLLQLRRNLFGRNHLDVAHTLASLGEICKYQSRFNEAKTFYIQALAIFEEQLGLQHPYTQNARRNIASCS